MKRIPRTPGEAPAREFEPVPLADRRKREPKVPRRLVPPAGAVRRDPATGPERDPELQGH